LAVVALARKPRVTTGGDRERAPFASRARSG
jgi:hypothetical protein